MRRSPAYGLLLFLLACSPAISKGQHSFSGLGALQVLLDSAKRGEVVTIPPGVYTGNLLISKTLILRGIGTPTIRGDGRGSCITIVADSCVLDGFIIENSGRMLVNEDAGILVKSSHNSILNNVLRDVLFGIYLYSADFNMIAHNRVVGRHELQVGERGSGIHIWNSRYNSLVKNRILQARDGIYIQNANHTLIIGNEVSDLRYGLHYMYADSNQFLYNKFYDNVAGAAIMYSTGILMRHNAFIHNRGFASYGILFQDCHGMLADSNAISDNVTGLFFEASTDNIFRHNIIARNDVALQMFQNSVNNTFTENNFIDNLSPVTIVGKRTGSQWNRDGVGNYWSNYDGYDLDGDGIGDVPMKIQNVFNYLEGSYPSVRLYLYSPSSQALAFAAKAFPIVSINQELDSHPLIKPVPLRSLEFNASDMVAAGISGPTPNGAWWGVPIGGLCVGGFLFTWLSKRGPRWFK